ncbi:MAG: glycosyltransferase family 39 protein [Candidatus Nanoperiomorbaceae bacterium]
MGSFKAIHAFVAKREKTLAIMSVGAVVVIFVILCATQISRWSMWFDESFTHYLIRFNMFDITRYTMLDVHPPLFYWMLKLWSLMFGTSDVALRSMSVFFGVVVIVLGFLLARRLFGKKVGYLSLPLLGLSPMLLRYSIETRMYTMVAMIALAQILVLIKARADGRRRWWIAYGVLVAAGMWTHYYTALVVLAQWAWLFVVSHKKLGEMFGFARGQKITWRGFWQQIFRVKTGNFLQALFVAVVLFAPWLLMMVKQLTTVVSGGFWASPVGLGTLPDLLATTFLYQLSSTTTGWLAAGLIVLIVGVIYLFVKLWREQLTTTLRQNLLLISLSCVLPPLLLMIISLPPLRSSFVDRYVLGAIMLAPIMLAIVVGLSRQTIVKNFLYVLTIVLLISGMGAVVYFGNYNKTTNLISTAKSLMVKIADNSDGRTIPVIADTAWTFYDADAYATSRQPVYFLNSQMEDYYYGVEKILATSPNKIVGLNKWTSQHHILQVWYISATNNATKLPPELGSDKSRWTPLRTIRVVAPNDWGGSSNAVLYEINH